MDDLEGLDHPEFHDKLGLDRQTEAVQPDIHSLEEDVPGQPTPAR
jgi:hypothetical protein